GRRAAPRPASRLARAGRPRGSSAGAEAAARARTGTGHHAPRRWRRRRARAGARAVLAAVGPRLGSAQGLPYPIGMAGTRDTSSTPSAGPPADQTPREPVGAEQVRELVGVTGGRGT